MTPELEKKVQQAIRLIQAASRKATEAGQVIEVAYSSGKDSDVILELTRMANVPYRAIYKNTTIDPPYTVKHAKDNGVEIRMPKKTFFQLIEQNGFPTRFYRYCCEKLKEYKILDYAILGIRADESNKRKERYKEPEQCRSYRTGGKVRQYFPILTWTLEDEEEFIKERNIRLHPLYYNADGTLDLTKRLGCLCCPLQSRKKRIIQFKQYPNMLRQYIRRGGQRLDNQKAKRETKSVNRFNNIYEIAVMDIFCNTVQEFRERFGKNLFNDGIDCKKFLEEYFNVKLPDYD